MKKIAKTLAQPRQLISPSDHSRLRCRAPALAKARGPGARSYCREAKEAGARERQTRKSREIEHRQRQTSNNQAAWVSYIDCRVSQHLPQWTSAGPEPLIDAIGEVVAVERAARRKEVKQAVDEERRSMEARLAALEERFEQRLNSEARKEAQRAIERERLAPDAKLETTARALSQRCGLAVEDSRRTADAKLDAIEQRL
jgi:hypothetical protein